MAIRKNPKDPGFNRMNLRRKAIRSMKTGPNRIKDPSLNKPRTRIRKPVKTGTGFIF